MEMNTGTLDMASHWLFPTFLGVMTLVIGILVVKSVFMSNDDKDKKDKDDE